MSEHRKKNKSKLPLLMAKGVISVIALVLILIGGSMAVKFCMGLFMTGDHIVRIPGFPSPVLYRTAAAEEAGLQQSDNVAQSAQATITVAGDLMMHMPIVTSGESDGGYNFDSIFTHISSYISKADYAAVNLETTLSGTDNGHAYTGYPNFNSPDAIADAAKTAGFDLLLTGNEHCNDYGTFGLKRTLDILTNRGLDTLGTTGTIQDNHWAVKDIDGIRVGFVSYTYADADGSGDQPTVNGNQLDSNAAGLLNSFDYDQPEMFFAEMTRYIESMKTEGAEAIVLFIHWGDEYTDQITYHQETIAQKMCDLGVDVIVGSHSHVVQDVALLSSTTDPGHQTLCAYSLGNFLSNQRADNISLTTGQSEDGLLLSFSFSKYSDGAVYLDSIGAVYTWVLVREDNGEKDYHILPLDSGIGDWQTVFGLSKEELADAEESYARTNAALYNSLQEITETLREAKAARDDAYIASAAG